MPTIRKNVGTGTAVVQQVHRSSQKRRRTDEAVPSRYRNRPSPVRVAIYRVWERSADLGFTLATTRVLQAILAAGVSADNPFNAVFAKKATLATLAGCSDVTVYRSMRQLEKDGWILREHQERLDDGMLDIGHIRITEKLAVLIGLVESIVLNHDIVAGISDEQGQNNAQHQIEKAECTSENLESVFSSSADSHVSLESAQKTTVPASLQTEMKHGMKDGPIYTGERCVYPKASVNYQSTRRQFVRMDGRSVAEELVWLITENRLTYGQMFKLQQLAKQVPGQELSDFVAYRSERLKQLETTNDCYRYLKKFIDEGIDARYLCAQRAKQQHRIKRTNQRKQVEDVVMTWAKALDGRTVVSSISGKAYLIHCQSKTIEVFHEGVPANISLKIDRRFMRAVQAGELVLQSSQLHRAETAKTPVRPQRTEEEIQRAESSIAAMKALLAKGPSKLTWSGRREVQGA